MKLFKAAGLTVLVAVLVCALHSLAAADPLTKASQLVNLSVENGVWTQIMSDGTKKSFQLAKNKYLVAKSIDVRFIPNPAYSGGLRALIQSQPFGDPPASTLFYAYGMDLVKDQAGNLLWAYYHFEFSAGLAFWNNSKGPLSLPPVFKVITPGPPSALNGGPEVPGTVIARVVGYIWP
jgi:hypothetical protein